MLRPATAADLPALDAIAVAAKRHWGYGDAQMRAWARELSVASDPLDTRPIWIAERDGCVAGFVQLGTDDRPWSLAALWVLPAAMGRGVGTALLRHACAVAAARHQPVLTIDADPHAAPFYRARGARQVGWKHAPIDTDPARVRPQFVLAVGAARARGLT